MRCRTTTLDEICSISKGKKHLEVESSSNAYRYIQIDDLHGGGVQKFTDEVGTVAEPADVLIAWDGANAGKVGVGFKGMIGSTLARLRPKIDGIESRFLFRYLESKFDLIKSQRTGATIPHVNGTMLRQMEIPIPPIHVQRQIADTLDKADALRRKDQELLQKYDELAQSIFYEMFGDPETNEHGFAKIPLGELMTIPNKLVDPRLEPYCNLLHVGGDNIESDTGKLVHLKPAKDLGLKSGKFLFNEHCILYNKIRPYLNKVALPDFEGVCSADMYPLIPSNHVNKLFLYYVLKSEDFLSFASNQSRRANIPKINREELSQYLCILPPLDMQIRFADILSNIRRQDNIVESQIASSSWIFTSLLNSYFNN